VQQDTPLGEFEVVVLMAVLRLGADAFGSAVRDEIADRSGRRVSRGSMTSTPFDAHLVAGVF
jgi:hypothetical protein